MDQIRKLVADRIEQLGLNPRRVSLRLNKHPGYMHEWINGKQQSLPYEVKVMLAQELGVDVRQLGAAPAAGNGERASGLHEDAVAYQPPDGSNLAVRPHIAYFRMTSRALDQHERPILPGQILAFDINRADPTQIKSGSIVIVQRLSKTDFTKSEGSVIRQFVRPNKLITNSSVQNEIVSIDDPELSYEPVIKGVMVGLYDSWE